MPKLPRLQDRSSGVLLHLSSLPGPGSVGTLGAPAHQFADQLAEAGQRWWQMLPVGPVGEAYSPYSSPSSFAGEPLFIDLTDLVARGYLTRSEARLTEPKTLQKTAYRSALKEKNLLLRLAYGRAKRLMTGKSMVEFRRREKFWLADYCLFAVLSRRFKTPKWWQWPKAFADRDRHTLAGFRREASEELGFEEFCQFLFDRQWRDLRKHCKSLGIGLIGDIPIFVAAGSSDTWANRDSFLLKKNGAPAYVAGCPPDDFNANGQLWGNALYDWNRLKRQRFPFWMARLGRLYNQFDVCRLDHFIGFKRYWRIPAGAKTARGGKWQPAPGEVFFKAVTKRFGQDKFIAEDLGSVSPAVRKLRDDFGFPGMKLIQFSFGEDPESQTHRPYNYSQNSIVYTGTHDNNTTKGWLNDVKGSKGKKQWATIMGSIPLNADPVWALNLQALNSPANVCILPLQDVLTLDGKSRMNTPGTAGPQNWSWRLPPGQFDKKTRDLLRRATLGSHRL